ncbi:MAG: hypothetical protein AB7P33_09650 [Dehalococcoidia bacterium]
MKLFHLVFGLLAVVPFVLLPSAAVQAAAPSIGGCSIFPSDHVWNTPINTLPKDANSAAYVNTIGASKGLKADFGSGLWDGGPIGIPFVTVTGSQQKYPATFYYPDESDPGPYAIPLSAPIEGGSNATGDRHVISLDTTNCLLYEMFDATPGANAWSAGSGAIFDLKSYALRQAGWTSADAAGFAILPGLVRYEEILAGEITHAIRFTAPQTRNTYIWPATHKASSLTGTQYPPMGQRFRLRADFDVSGYSMTNQIILNALKKYGMILADNGSSWYMSGVPDSRWNNDDLNKLKAVLGSNLEAIDESSLMISPTSGQAKQPGGTTPPPAAPAITSISPSSIQTGSFTLTINGSGFQSGATVKFGSTSLTATGTSTSLTASGTVSIAGTVAVSVVNPGGTTSNSMNVTVTAAPAVKVTVSPTSATVQRNRTKQFSATVTNTTNKAVTWKVNGVTGGNGTVGTISSTGVYRAPASVPSPATVTVTACSVASPTVCANATVTVRR